MEQPHEEPYPEDHADLLDKYPAAWIRYFQQELTGALTAMIDGLYDLSVELTGDGTSPSTTGVVIRFRHVHYPGCELGYRIDRVDWGDSSWVAPPQSPSSWATVIMANVIEQIDLWLPRHGCTRGEVTWLS